MSKSKFPAKRIAIDAIFIAVFFALSMFSVEIGGVKLTFTSLPAVICAMIYGPVDGFLVGFLGAFLEQMLRYGFTATTLLWVLPPAIRGLTIGLATVLFRKSLSLDSVLSGGRKLIPYFAVCLTAAVITSLGNTVVYYIDAKMYGYYTYELIFGVAGIRVVTNLISSALTAIVALPVLAALRKAKLIQSRTPAVSTH